MKNLICCGNSLSDSPGPSLGRTVLGTVDLYPSILPSVFQGFCEDEKNKVVHVKKIFVF